MPIIRKTLKVRDLPREWAAQWQDPEHVVSVTIVDADPELDQASSLSEVMDVIGARAQKRGLTPGLLQQLLHEK